MESERRAHSVGQLMADSEGGFGKILKRARALERLGHRVSGFLGDDLAGECQLANVRDGKMIFTCISPGIATRLRMQAPALLEQLHEVGMSEIREIEVRLALPG